MIPWFVGAVVRQSGKSFLRFTGDIDTGHIAREGHVRGGDVSLYIHIPFCKTLCPFCCFNRYLFKEDQARAYFADLRREVAIYAGLGFKFNDFYFGGGTPTVLMDELAGFVDFLRSRFEIRRISLETTPRELTPETIDQLRQIGVNRLSIGVQSFDNSLLKAMGRTLFKGEDSIRKLKLAQGKFDTVNVDLMFNFPTQTPEQFRSDIKIFKELGSDQATFYPLMPSPHKLDALTKKFRKVDTSREKQFYEIILQELLGGGYKASTAWCFSRGDLMIDEYIIDYDDYIGVGAGSVSFLGGDFLVNSFSLEGYHKLIAEDGLPIVRTRRLSATEQYRYYMLTRFFGMGLNAQQFRQRFNSDIHARLWAELLFFKSAGVIKEEDGIISVTRRGMYPVGTMMKEFFAALNTLREYCIEGGI
ncbi:MAG: coproporphyrinogen III oxidase family protein [Dehalococcoidia bacterium]|nr:coproporphyrinogen III oxidase family protein [Dehalococcoidia bacterium]